jgi:hypothetical protein
MDVDLSTNLYALLPLNTPLYAGQADIGVGSGLMHGAAVTPGNESEMRSPGATSR